jgi:hypothetical protein
LKSLDIFEAIRSARTDEQRESEWSFGRLLGRNLRDLPVVRSRVWLPIIRPGPLRASGRKGANNRILYDVLISAEDYMELPKAVVSIGLPDSDLLLHNGGEDTLDAGVYDWQARTTVWKDLDWEVGPHFIGGVNAAQPVVGHVQHSHASYGLDDSDSDASRATTVTVDYDVDADDPRPTVMLPWFKMHGCPLHGDGTSSDIVKTKLMLPVPIDIVSSEEGFDADNYSYSFEEATGSLLYVTGTQVVNDAGENVTEYGIHFVQY